MKESLWGYLIISLGLVIIAVLLLVQRLTTTNEEDFYLGREVMEAAMIDAIDYGTYRNTGDLVMSEQKFVEVFIRRFAESVTPNKTYSLDFYDIHEYPPKATVRIKTTSGATEIKSDSFDVNIDTFLHGILETIWGQGDLQHVTKSSNRPLVEEEVGTTGFGGDTDPYDPSNPDSPDGSFCDKYPNDVLCVYRESDTCNGNKCYLRVRYYSVAAATDITSNSRNRTYNYSIEYNQLSDHLSAAQVKSCEISELSHSNDLSVFTKWRELKNKIKFRLVNAKSEGIIEDASTMYQHSAGEMNFKNKGKSCTKDGRNKLIVNLNFEAKNLDYNKVLPNAMNGSTPVKNVLFIPTQYYLSFEYDKSSL